MPLHHLETAIEAAVVFAAQAFPQLTDKDIEVAYLTYRDYFKKVRQGKDLPPPESTVRHRDALLESIWECLCAREEERMDVELLNGRLGPVHRPVTTLEEVYQLCFNEMRAVCRSYRKTEGPRGYLHEVKDKLGDRLLNDPAIKARLADDLPDDPANFNALADSRGIRLTPLPTTGNAEEEAIIIEAATQPLNSPEALANIKKMITAFPQLLYLKYELANRLIDSDDEEKEEQGFALLEKTLEDHPRNPLLLSAYLENLFNIDQEAMVKEAKRLKFPASLTELDAAPGGTYDLLTYLRFSSVRVILLLLKGEERSATEELADALKIGLTENLYRPFIHPFIQHSLRQIEEGTPLKDFPEKAIGQYDDLKLASLALQKAWLEAKIEYSEQLIKGYQQHLYPAALDQDFPWPRNPDNVERALQLKVTIEGISPEIFRTIIVPDDTLLPDLHGMLQTAFGWQNAHLHLFRTGDKDYLEPDPYEELEGIDYRSVRIREVLKNIGDQITYIYDYGDYWTHYITLEATPEVNDEILYPRCVAGARACPPEDVGGVAGYERMLGILNNPADKEYAEFLTWLPQGYDPEGFDLAWTHRQLWKGRFWSLGFDEE